VNIYGDGYGVDIPELAEQIATDLRSALSR